MVKQADIKATGIVIVGVLAAGAIMAYFAGNQAVDTARAGYGG